MKKVILSYTRYNHWANETMTQWLKTLERELLYKKTISSFDSIDRTVQHMNHAQNFWFTILTEADLSKLDETIKLNSADSVMNELVAGSQKLLNKIEKYTKEELLKQVSSNDMVQSRYEFMMHVVNHNSYHRGQIVTMSRGLGVEENIPAMDYDAFLWSLQ